MGWKWGCQPFSCRCSQNMTHWQGKRRFARQVCLRNPFPPFLLGISIIHSLPEAGSWQRQYAPPALHYGCIMPIPSLQLQEMTCLMQRSRGFGHGAVVPKICYNAVIVLSVVLSDCCKPMNTCRDWAFSNSGLEVGVPAFQLPMFPECDAVPKEISWTCLFKFFFGNSTRPLPARSRFLRAAERSTCFALWLHPAHPFDAATEKECVSCKEAECLVTELWLQDLLQSCDCALSCAVRLLQTNEHLSRLSF